MTRWKGKEFRSNCIVAIMFMVRVVYVRILSMKQIVIVSYVVQRGISSVGRARALHAWGRRFDSGILHIHTSSTTVSTTYIRWSRVWHETFHLHGSKKEIAYYLRTLFSICLLNLFKYNSCRVIVDSFISSLNQGVLPCT